MRVVSRVADLEAHVALLERQQDERVAHAARLQMVIDVRDRELASWRKQLAAARDENCDGGFAGAVCAAWNGNRNLRSVT